MAVYLTSLTITPNSVEMTPTFDSSIHQYRVIQTNINKISITAVPNDFIESPVYVGFLRKEDNKTWISESSGSYTIEVDLLNGDNTFIISLQSDASKIPIQTSSYKLSVLYSSGSTTWPIYNNNLKPGYYGGSYIPNYRYLREIFTCGSGDNNFEGDYANKKLLNEESIKYLDDFISFYTRFGKLDSIVETFVHYSGFVNTNWPNDGDYRYYLPLIEVGVDRPDHMRNNFKPKNNKLFSYPYTSLKIMGYGGESELKYELFPENIRFGIVSKFFAGQSIQLYPVNYEGILDAYNAGVTGQPLPVFPYTKDQYLNEWNAISNSRNQNINAMEQNKNLQILQSVIGGATQAASAGLSNAIMSKMSNIDPVMSKISTGVGIAGNIATMGANIHGAVLTYNQGLAAMAAQLKDTEARPSSIANQNASPAIPAVMKDAVVPYVQRHSIREVFAKKIDEFFTCYGYRTNRNGIPNIKSRPSFNFLRCTQAKIEGNIPNEDLLQIKAVLEHGVTFWHNHDVGNYNLSNPAPITNKPRYCLPVG